MKFTWLHLKQKRSLFSMKVYFSSTYSRWYEKDKSGGKENFLIIIYTKKNLFYSGESNNYLYNERFKKRKRNFVNPFSKSIKGIVFYYHYYYYYYYCHYYDYYHYYYHHYYYLKLTEQQLETKWFVNIYFIQFCKQIKGIHLKHVDIGLNLEKSLGINLTSLRYIIFMSCNIPSTQ